jgi:D-aminopeptidase
MHKNILVIADIEGSSGCFNRDASLFMGKGWSGACRAMSNDVDAVVRALFDAGAETVAVKDFHRTGYNILPELLDPRCALRSGYEKGPVPGIGDPGRATALVMMGMHAPSGSDGFLAHTLTSRIARLEVNGKLLSEAELFSASLAPFGVRPLLFSGCPVACRYATEALPGILTVPIDKSTGEKSFDAAAWRDGLARAAALSLAYPGSEPYDPPGPMEAAVTMRDGPAAARKLARPWDYTHEGDRVLLRGENLRELYDQMIRLCYFTPLAERFLTAALFIYTLAGKAGRAWVRLRTD